ncbi:Myotubularin-related protein 10 [Frankliniella fusca]|uniref:Myotubularin-related protein 10 n=1 Tax=Frankliniella fusca TaxID=407009 RepID=A0AAE1GPE3_9NEOP|nr:Myotubularin-related protein 10 [Frankliniella fusca]
MCDVHSYRIWRPQLDLMNLADMDERRRCAGGCPRDAGHGAELLCKYFQDNVARLERRAKERRMQAGSLVTRQVSVQAALELERARLATLRLKLSRAGAAGEVAAEAAAAGPGPGPSGCPGTREAACQTDDDGELLQREELIRLRATRDRLREATRGMPKNTANMVELLKKRNAVLLGRKQREVRRARAERVALEQRLRQLQQRLAELRAPSAPRGSGLSQQ